MFFYHKSPSHITFFHLQAEVICGQVIVIYSCANAVLKLFMFNAKLLQKAPPFLEMP